MIKHLVTAGFLLALTIAAGPLASPAGAAADCGLAALLSPCPVPPPAPIPLPVPPVLDVAPALPVPPATPALPVQPATPAPVVAPTPNPSPPAPDTSTRAPVPAAADRLVQLVNEARAGAGLPALAVSPRAASIAADHSMAMAARGSIFHNPAYLTAATRSSLGARALGENVAMNGSVEAAHHRLMASPGHRSNILDAGFDAVGVAVVRDGSGTLYLTQNFLDSAGTAGSKQAPRATAAPGVAGARPNPVGAYRAASAPTPAPAGPAAAAPDGDDGGVVLSARSLAAGGPGDSGTAGLESSASRLWASSVAALALLAAVAGAAIRLLLLA